MMRWNCAATSGSSRPRIGTSPSSRGAAEPAVRRRSCVVSRGSAPSWSSAVAHTWACSRSRSAHAGGAPSGPSPRASAASTASAVSTRSRPTRSPRPASGPATASSPSSPTSPSTSAARIAGQHRRQRLAQERLRDRHRLRRALQPGSGCRRQPGEPLHQLADIVAAHPGGQPEVALGGVGAAGDLAGGLDQDRLLQPAELTGEDHGIEQLTVGAAPDRAVAETLRHHDACVRSTTSRRESSSASIPPFCRGPPTFQPLFSPVQKTIILDFRPPEIAHPNPSPSVPASGDTSRAPTPLHSTGTTSGQRGCRRIRMTP